MAVQTFYTGYENDLANSNWEFLESCNCNGAHWKIYTNSALHLLGTEIWVGPYIDKFKIVSGGSKTFEGSGDLLKQKLKTL